MSGIEVRTCGSNGGFRPKTDSGAGGSPGTIISDDRRLEA